MAFGRHNRPSIMIYGGTIMPGYSETLRKPINISTCYEAHGAFLYDTLKSEANPSLTKDDIMTDIEQHACPGAGACGGMVCHSPVRCEVMLIVLQYTANTMATAIEAMGLSLPGSSSTPAESPAKMRECAKAADAIKICMERNIKPRDMLTKKSFENAMVPHLFPLFHALHSPPSSLIFHLHAQPHKH